ncbi:MAG: hypothetical protein ACXW0Z_08335 [Gemmatirosa sp.]
MPALTARDTAYRLIARESAAPGSPPPDDGAAAERALHRLAGELTGWFGPFGTHALITRALAHARAEHPSLGGVTLGTPSALNVEGLAHSARGHGAAGAAGAVELLAWIIELLGRLIGDELAAVLVASGASREADQPAPVPPVPPVPPVSPVPRAVGGAAETGAGGGGTGMMGDTTGSTTDD